MPRSESSSVASASGDTLLIMKIDIGDGRTGKIDVKAGEEYNYLARRFCAEHGLPADEVAPMLADHIEKSVQETLASGRSSRASAASAASAASVPSSDRADATEIQTHHKEPRSHDQASSKATRRDSDGGSAPQPPRPDSASSAPTGSEKREDRIQSNYSRFSKEDTTRSRSETSILRHREEVPQAAKDGAFRQGASSEWSPPDPRWEGRQSISETRSERNSSIGSSPGRPLSSRVASSWDQVPMSMFSDFSKSSTQKGGTPVWKKLYAEGMKHKVRKQERIEQEKRKWIAPPGPRRAAGPDSAEFAHLYTPRPKSAPRERPGRSDWYEEASAKDLSRSASRKKSRAGEEGRPVWERLYQECRIKNEQRKMLARMERDEEAVTSIFDSISRPPRRNAHDPEIFERLYESGLQKQEQKLRRHEEAQKAKVDKYFQRRKSMHDGKAVKPFQPDIHPSTRALGREKPLEDDLDALGLRKKLCLEEREVLRDCMQLESCTFQPQICSDSRKLASEARQRSAAVHEELYEQMQAMADKKRALRDEYACARTAPAKRLTKDQKQAVVERLWSRHELQLQKMEEEKRKKSAQSPRTPRAAHLARLPHGESHGYGPGLDSTSSKPAFRPGGTPDEEAGRVRGLELSRSAERRAVASSAPRGAASSAARARTAEDLYDSRHLDALERTKLKEAQERRFAELAAMAKTCRGSKRIMEKKQDEHLRALFMVLDRNNQGAVQAPMHAVQARHLKGFFADAAVADLVVDALADHATVSSAVITYDIFREVCMHQFKRVLPNGFSGWHLIFGHSRRAASNHGMGGGHTTDDSGVAQEMDEDGDTELPFFTDDAGEISPVCGPHPERVQTPGSQRRAAAGQFYRDEMERARMKEAWLQQKRRHRELRELAQCTFTPAVCTPNSAAHHNED